MDVSISVVLRVSVCPGGLEGRTSWMEPGRFAESPSRARYTTAPPASAPVKAETPATAITSKIYKALLKDIDTSFYATRNSST
jgi:hypothetical protein